jgi:signal transduction histidine kinase
MKRFNLEVSLEIEHPIPDLSEDQQFHIYWSLRELLFNVIKHAHVPEAGIMMQRVHETCLQFIVSDAGSGFDPATTEMRNSPHEHFGLSGIQGRMAALQGAVTIHSLPGKGTRAVLTIPLPHPSSPNRSSV